MMAHRNSTKRSESLPNTLPGAMFGNGQHSAEDNPNYLVYKKVSNLIDRYSPFLIITASSFQYHL